ncbi:MAG: LamG-like jellyroll fold domain-containing protein, partial [Pirellulales bacterium]
NNGSTNTGVPRAAILDGNWHHVVASWDTISDQTRLYVDGALAGSAARSTTAMGAAGSFVIGQEQDTLLGGFSNGQRFVGDLDEVAIYNTVLPDSTIAAHYIAGFGAVACGLALDSGSDFVANLDDGNFDAIAVNGAVDVTDANLSVKLAALTGLSNDFVIIDNDAADAVSGTFLGLPEAATLTASGPGGANVPMITSYLGGDGNDVVLTFDADPVIDADVSGAPEINNDIEVRLDGAGNLQVEVDNTLVISGLPLNDFNSLTINGQSGSDTLRIDTANGSPIPTGGIRFDGGETLEAIAGGGLDRGDKLILQGAGHGFSSETYFLGTSDVAGSPNLNDPEAGTFRFSSGIVREVSFVNVESEDAGSVTASAIDDTIIIASLSVVGNSLGNILTLTDSLPNNFVDGVSFVRGGTDSDSSGAVDSGEPTFVPLNFSNKFGSTTLNAAGGDDTIVVMHSEAVNVKIDGSLGNDVLDMTALPSPTANVSGPGSQDEARGGYASSGSGGGTPAGMPQSGNYDNIGSLLAVGGKLLGSPVSPNVFNITGGDSGTITAVGVTAAFTGFADICGGAAADLFNVHTGGSLSGEIDAQRGNDTLNYRFINEGPFIDVDLETGDAQGIGGGLVAGNTGSSIENVFGG